MAACRGFFLARINRLGRDFLIQERVTPADQLAVLKHHRRQLVVGDFVVARLHVGVVIQDFVAFAVLARENFGSVGIINPRICSHRGPRPGRCRIDRAGAGIGAPEWHRGASDGRCSAGRLRVIDTGFRIAKDIADPRAVGSGRVLEMRTHVPAGVGVCK